METKKLSFKNSKGQKLVGNLTRPDKKCPIAIFCHGYRSTKESSKAKMFAEMFPPLGIGVFAFDFSGRGESDGKFEDTTLTQYIDDLKSCVSFLEKHTSFIMVIGSSFGGKVSLEEISHDKRVKALALISPASRFPWKKKEEFADIAGWKKKGFAYTHSDRFGKMKINYSFYEDCMRYRDYEKFSRIKIPTLIVHGTADKSVSVEDSKKLHELIPQSTLILVDGADHTFTKKEDQDFLMKRVCEFIASQGK